MAVLPELLAASECYAAAFTTGDPPAPSGRQVAIRAGVDGRPGPAKVPGLEEGDGHVIRHAAEPASVAALRSLIISQRPLDMRGVVVIHHTDCGMPAFSNEELQRPLKDDCGADASGWAFLPFAHLARSVRDDVAAIRASPFIPRDTPGGGSTDAVRPGRRQRVE